MQIIEFLMANLFFVVIILWFVFNLMRRRRNAEGEQQAEQQRQRSEQQIGHEIEEEQQEQNSRSASFEFPWEKVEEAMGGQRSSSEQQLPTVEQRPPLRDQVKQVRKEASRASESYKVQKRQYEKLERKRNRTKQMADRIKSATATGNLGEVHQLEAEQDRLKKHELRKIIDFASMNRKSVVQGFIWSEVFAQPRGRRKFSKGGFLEKR